MAKIVDSNGPMVIMYVSNSAQICKHMKCNLLQKKKKSLTAKTNSMIKILNDLFVLVMNSVMFTIPKGRTWLHIWSICIMWTAQSSVRFKVIVWPHRHVHKQSFKYSHCAEPGLSKLGRHLMVRHLLIIYLLQLVKIYIL